MITPVLLLLQTAAVPPPKPRCPPTEAGGDVVVCGKADQEQFRLRPLPDRFEQKKSGPGLETDLGGGAKANLYSTGGSSADGKPDNRIMAKFRVPF